MLRRLRNNLVHGEFTAARLHLEQLGLARRPAAVRVATFELGTLTLERLAAAIESAAPFAVEDCS